MPQQAGYKESLCVGFSSIQRLFFYKIVKKRNTMRVFKLSDDTCILKWEKGAYIRTGSPLDHDVVFNFKVVSATENK